MKTVFIAGGGTGGHIYPGIAIARALMKKQQDIQVHFVGTTSGLEKKIIPKEGFPLHFVAGGKLNMSGRIIDKLKTIVKLPIGFFQSLVLLLKYKPNFVIGVGGYASGPFVLVASLLGIQTAIWEPNAHPGMANRWLAHFVDCCYVVFEAAKKYLNNENIFQFGMPVRAEIESPIKQNRNDDQFHLLSFGGSQGSRYISTVLSDAMIESGEWNLNLKLVHQSGSVDFEKLKQKYNDVKNVELLEYIYDMPKYYAWADLVVCRGGASTIAELAAFGVVPIIVPLPAADNHQEKNAESLVKIEAGIMILQNDFTKERLISEVKKLRENPELLKKMSTSLKNFFQPKASENIASDIISRMRNET